MSNQRQVRVAGGIKRALCALTRHRTRHWHPVSPATVETAEGRPWVVTAEVECWCGHARYLEGAPS